jgi:hypothetical protein
MTYQVTTISVRPSTSVRFFTYPDQFIDKWKSQGTASTTLTVSDDKLTETRVTIWSTEEVYTEFRTEKSDVLANRDEYNTSSNIIRTTTTTNI